MVADTSTDNIIPELNIRDRAPRVLLAYPHSANWNVSPPLNLAMIGAVLREGGCEVRVVDAAAELVKDGASRLQAALDEMDPDVVAISLIVGNSLEAYNLIEKLFSSRNIPLIAGGPHASVLPEEALDHGVHIVARGEGEITTAELVEWMKGRKDLSSIDGISYRARDGSIRHNPDRAYVDDLDTLPLPAHDLFNPDDYFSIPADRINAGKIISSRGCPNHCTFCSNPVFGRRFRYRSPESIVAEMEMLKERYGIDRFEFVDDSFTTNRRRLMELASVLRKMPDVTFSCVTRLENLDEETVPALRMAGLYRAHIGVESARPQTLKRIRKNIKLEKLEPTLQLLRKNGIDAALFFMFGFPWENAEQMRETNRFIERLRPLTKWFNEGGVVVPYPGTEIYEQYHDSVGFTEWWLTSWQPPDSEPLHPLQPYYFFQYDEDEKAAIREGLDIIFEHNRREAGFLKEIERLRQIIDDLEKQVHDRDNQLRELWNRSTEERMKKILAFVRGIFSDWKKK